jgi:zinc transport system ATP-binding protein
MDVLVKLEKCHFSYGSVKVLQNVNFSVGPRKIVCIVGPNGGGKSTLLKLILGLERPESGKIEVLGKSPKRAREQVGYMPQQVNFDPLFPISVEEIVRMGRLNGNGIGFSRKADRLATDRTLEDLGLSEYRNSRYMQLSGGLKQRVLIARALVNDPKLLLLDEPTAMVDAHIEARLLEHLKQLHDRMTILLVSHDVSFVSGLVDEVVCVNRDVAVHPVEAVSDHFIHELYGEKMQSVDHDHDCREGASK